MCSPLRSSTRSNQPSATERVRRRLRAEEKNNSSLSILSDLHFDCWMSSLRCADDHSGATRSGHEQKRAKTCPRLRRRQSGSTVPLPRVCRPKVKENVSRSFPLGVFRLTGRSGLFEMKKDKWCPREGGSYGKEETETADRRASMCAARPSSI